MTSFEAVWLAVLVKYSMCQNGISLTIPVYFSAMIPQCILHYTVRILILLLVP